MPVTRRTNTPTRSRPAPRSVRNAPTGWCRRRSTPGSPKSAPAGATATTIPIRSCMSVFKDGVPANTHFVNVLPDGAAAPAVDRVPLYEVYMRMAEELAKRSTCARLQVGTVVTDQVLENVLAIGYNGNARGLPNKCDSAVPGSCGCIHLRMNAAAAPRHRRIALVGQTASIAVVTDRQHVLEHLVRHDGPDLQPGAGGALRQLFGHAHVHLVQRNAVDRRRSRAVGQHVEEVRIGRHPVLKDAHAAPDRDRSPRNARGRVPGRARCRTPTAPARWSVPDAPRRGSRACRRIRSSRAPHGPRSNATRLDAPPRPAPASSRAPDSPARHPLAHPLDEVL